MAWVEIGQRSQWLAINNNLDGNPYIIDASMSYFNISVTSMVGFRRRWNETELTGRDRCRLEVGYLLFLSGKGKRRDGLVGSVTPLHAVLRASFNLFDGHMGFSSIRRFIIILSFFNSPNASF